MIGSAIENRHKAEMSSGEPFAINVSVRAVSGSRPGGLRSKGKLVSRRHITKESIQIVNSRSISAGKRIVRIR